MHSGNNRILELNSSSEEAVAARVLVLVHKAIDENFPEAAKPGRQFTKTVFSEDAESTAISRAPAELIADGEKPLAFATEEKTNPLGKTEPPTPPKKADSLASAEAESIPAAPSVPKPSQEDLKGTEPLAATSAKDQDVSAQIPAQTQGMASQAYLTVEPEISPDQEQGTDWRIPVTLAFLLGGLIVLAYALFA